MTQAQGIDPQLELEVSSELEQAKKLLKEIPVEALKNGDWFLHLLGQVINAHQKNLSVDYFKQKYPGYTQDEIADKVISATENYAAVVGGLTGVAASAGLIASIPSGGVTTAIWLSSIGAEIMCVAMLQLKLVLDLAIVYDIKLDPEDPEDIMTLFSYGLGIKTTTVVGDFSTGAATHATKNAVKSYFSKGKLKSVQSMGRVIGIKILQRDIIKYAVPMVGVVVGSSYNYLSTRSLGRIAKQHFKHRGKSSQELHKLISGVNTYTLVFPAALLYMANIDGNIEAAEHKLYTIVSSQMAFDEYEQSIVDQLAKDEHKLLESMREIDPEQQSILLRLLMLMAVSDGETTDEEVGYLMRAAECMNQVVDFELLAQMQQQQQQQHAAQQGVFTKWQGQASEALTAVNQHLQNAAQTAAQNVQSTAQNTKLGAVGVYNITQYLVTRGIDEGKNRLAGLRNAPHVDDASDAETPNDAPPKDDVNANL